MTKAVLSLMVLALWATPAQAQDDALAGAVTQIVNENLDGANPDSWPRLIEIFQGWGISESYGVSVDEVRWLVRSIRDDADARERLARNGDKPGSIMTVQNRKLTCAEAQQKADAADQLARTLTILTQVQTIAAGLAAATGAGAILTVPIGVGILTTSIAGYWAGQVAAQYKSIAASPGTKCGSLEGQWNSKPSIRAFGIRSLEEISPRGFFGFSLASPFGPAPTTGRFTLSLSRSASAFGR
jgi:hypothetical protein